MRGPLTAEQFTPASATVYPESCYQVNGLALPSSATRQLCSDRCQLYGRLADLAACRGAGSQLWKCCIKPGSGHAQVARTPVPDNVIYAVCMSFPPKQMLVTI